MVNDSIQIAGNIKTHLSKVTNISLDVIWRLSIQYVYKLEKKWSSDRSLLYEIYQLILFWNNEPYGDVVHFNKVNTILTATPYLDNRITIKSICFVKR
jgi:hypothetical protein